MTETEDKQVITVEDLADALNGHFLDKLKEFAWLAKEHRNKEDAVEDIEMFQVHLSLQFPADAEDKNPLTFDKMLGYHLSVYPVTKEEIANARNQNEAIEKAE